MIPFGYVIECGNCGNELFNRNHAYLAHDYVEHIRSHHTGNIHIPNGYVVYKISPDE